VNSKRGNDKDVLQVEIYSNGNVSLCESTYVCLLLAPVEMENKQDINFILQAYCGQFQHEDHHQLLLYLKTNERLYDRNNFNGHITASAFIADAREKQMLLLKHKVLDRYLQPGGHIEEEDPSILKAALREASEETGIPSEELIYVPLNSSANVPLDIDSHYIPANKNRNEQEHIHHDFRYLFVYNGDKNIDVPSSEANGARWVSFSAFEEMETFSLVAKKIAGLLL
jgi:8-oxo-dGTP pyrophosphatase MutT (NUDIX family)